MSRDSVLRRETSVVFGRREIKCRPAAIPFGDSPDGWLGRCDERCPSPRRTRRGGARGRPRTGRRHPARRPPGRSPQRFRTL